MAKAWSAIQSTPHSEKMDLCSGLPTPGGGPSPGALTQAGDVILSPARRGGVAIRGPAALGEGAGFLVCLQPAGQRTEVTHGLEALKGQGNTLSLVLLCWPLHPWAWAHACVPSWAHACVCPLGGSRSLDKVALRSRGSPRGHSPTSYASPMGPGGLRPWWLPPGCAWVIATCPARGRTPSELTSLALHESSGMNRLAGLAPVLAGRLGRRAMSAWATQLPGGCIMLGQQWPQAGWGPRAPAPECTDF